MLWIAIWTVIQTLLIFFLLYVVNNLINKHRSLEEALYISEMNERCSQYLADKYLIQLSHSTPRCGMCGKMTSNDKKRVRRNIPYCPDCYRKIMQEDYVRQYDKAKGETYDDN